MSHQPKPPAARTPIQRVLDRLDEALWEMNGDEARTPMSNRGLERIVQAREDAGHRGGRLLLL